MSKRWLEIYGICILFLLLAVVSTYPLIVHFDTGIPYSPFGGEKVWNRSGDQIQLLYWFWLVKENLIGNVPFDSNPYEFNMGIPGSSTGLNTIPLAFLYMFFSPFGDIAAYNSTILSSYLLTGLFTYLLIRLYTGSWLGALVGAVIFTFAPSRIRGFTAGHGYGFLYFCYPFILYFLEKGIRSKKIRHGVISSIGIIGLSMLEPHLIYYICIFLGVYIPVRIITLFPVPPRHSSYSIPATYLTWRLPTVFAVIWMAGTAVTVYAQAYFHIADNITFFTREFWLAMIFYPLALLLLSLCFAALYQRFTPLDIEEGMNVEALSLLPLFFFLPLQFFVYFERPVEAGYLLTASLVAIFGIKFWLLRTYLRSGVITLFKEFRNNFQSVAPIFPLIISMGAIVYWMSSSKVEEVATTIAGGGRSLEDVAIFSAKLPDLLLPISNVYIGVIPGLLGACMLVSVIFHSYSGKRRFLFDNPDDFLKLFYIFIAFFSLILSLGLAFDEISLYALFFHYFPFFHYPRVSDRIITLCLFALAIIIGFAIKQIQEYCSDRPGGKVVPFMILSAAIFQLKDFNTFMPMGINILDRGQDVYTYVQKNIKDKFLLEIPLWPGDSHQSSLYQHYIMLDRVPRINGSSPMVLKKYIDEVFEPLSGMNQGRLGPDEYERLKSLGVGYITVHDNRDVFLRKVSPFPPITTVRRLQNSPFLEHVAIENSLHFKNWEKKSQHLFLFRVKDEVEISHDYMQAWYGMPFFYDANWRLHHQTGKVVFDEHLKKNVFQAVEGEDRSGFLVYGPYDTYPPGQYRCYFSIKAANTNNEETAKLEVASVDGDGNVTVLQDKTLFGNENAAYAKEFIDFSIQANTKLEFRVFYLGKGDVEVEKIVMDWGGNDAPLIFIEAENMVGDTGLVTANKEASSGKTVVSTFGKSKKGDMVYGPNRLYPQGRYSAKFNMRMQGNHTLRGTDIIAVITVRDGQNVTTWAKKNITPSEMRGEVFSALGLDFSLDRDEFLSFHVNYTGKASLELDGIEIIPK